MTGAAALTLALVGALVLAGCPAEPTATCSNGMPVVGASAGTERCASCDAGYGLTPAARCSPVGSAVAVGTGATFYSGEKEPDDLAAIGDTLYMVGNINDALYTVDTSDGTATQVGVQVYFGVGEVNPLGLGAIGDTLYLTGRGTGLYTLVLP